MKKIENIFVKSSFILLAFVAFIGITFFLDTTFGLNIFPEDISLHTLLKIFMITFFYIASCSMTGFMLNISRIGDRLDKLVENECR